MDLKMKSKEKNGIRTRWTLDVDPYVIVVYRFDDDGYMYTRVKNYDPAAPDITKLGDKFYVNFNSFQMFGVKDRQMAIDKFNRAIDIAKELEENIDTLCA